MSATSGEILYANGPPPATRPPQWLLDRHGLTMVKNDVMGGLNPDSVLQGKTSKQRPVDASDAFTSRLSTVPSLFFVELPKTPTTSLFTEVIIPMTAFQVPVDSSKSPKTSHNMDDPGDDSDSASDDDFSCLGCPYPHCFGCDPTASSAVPMPSRRSLDFLYFTARCDRDLPPGQRSYNDTPADSRLGRWVHSKRRKVPMRWPLPHPRYVQTDQDVIYEPQPDAVPPEGAAPTDPCPRYDNNAQSSAMRGHGKRYRSDYEGDGKTGLNLGEIPNLESETDSDDPASSMPALVDSSSSDGSSFEPSDDDDSFPESKVDLAVFYTPPPPSECGITSAASVF
jgi:hypothetical protein